MNHKNDYVKVASFVFLDGYRKRYDRDPSGVLYNKYITLLHRELKSQGTDIRLSHCWYRWGDAVVKSSVPYIEWTHDDLDKTSVSYKGYDPHINRRDPVVRYSEEYAGRFMDEYGDGIEGVEKAIDTVYSEAPFEFQRRYRSLRESLKITRSGTMVNESFESYVASLLEHAADVFPDEFNTIRKQFGQFRTVFIESLRNGASVDILYEMVESFWFFFCYHLRLNRKCHENVSRDTLRYWRSILPVEKSRFESAIQNYAYYHCRDSSEPSVTEMLRARESRLEELRTLLDLLE